ncbi:MAG: Response regulator receiver [Proteobacteria bacterium]|nr:Response regulator receiver [Pseudomonadota bacterium]
MLTSLLSSQGYQMVGALEDGNGVIEAIRQHSPEIVCLDYELPGRNGLDILGEINSTFPKIDVLFITASESPDIEARVADAGAAGFLRKPFGQKQVIDELQQVCDTRRRASLAKATESAPAASATAATAPKAARRSSERPTAVIADDNSSVRLLIKGLLAELGINVVGQAANGEEAVRAAQNLKPSVIFLDVNMPIMSGLEALPKIIETSPRTAVVMVTGDTSRAIVQQAAGLGARGYIVKPVRPAYVENFLKQLFNR